MILVGSRRLSCGTPMFAFRDLDGNGMEIVEQR
jgi:hypothetical protein